MAGEPGHTCARGPRCQTDYQARISGPLLDRIDLRVDMPAISALDLIQPAQSERSETVAQRVARARAVQAARYAALGFDPSMTNAHCSAKLIEDVARPDAAGLKLLRDASEQMRFSARAYHRILKVARTLADLDGVDQVSRIHLAGAISYRIGAERLISAA
jgi:magnesium chelatase family protein